MNFFKPCIFAVIVVLLAGGCQQPASQKGRTQLALAQQQFDDKQFVQAVQVLTEFLQSESHSQQAAQAHYLRGLCYRAISPEKDPLARGDFESALRKARSQTLAAYAHVSLGHIDFEQPQPDYDAALEHYLAALDDLDDAPPQDAVLYRLGLALQNLGRWDQADLYLSRCYHNFGDSEFADSARQRFGGRMFRIQVGAFQSLPSAQKAVTQWNHQGYHADWSMQSALQDLRYVVRLGRYDDFTQAQTALAKIAARQADAFIVVDTLTSNPDPSD